MTYDIQGRTLTGRSSAEDRVAFVRKVYLWLMGGFAVAGVGALSTTYAVAALASVLGRFWIFGLIIAFYGTFFWANRVSSRKPWNRYAYALFTYVAGILAGIAMISALQNSGPGIVVQAFAMTAGDFLVLSAVAIFSKKDFSFLRSFILMGLVIALFAMVIGIFFHAEVFHLMISALIVIVCSAKILWDTSNMLRTGDFSDPAGFALSLFISLLNIFISLLRLLGGRRD